MHMQRSRSDSTVGMAWLGINDVENIEWSAMCVIMLKEFGVSVPFLLATLLDLGCYIYMGKGVVEMSVVLVFLGGFWFLP